MAGEQAPDWGSVMSQMNNMQMPGQAQQQTPGQGPAQPTQAHHPMKKQLLQHLLQAFMSSPKTSVQDAIAGMKGLMGSYKSIASELDNFMPANNVDSQSPQMQVAKQAVAGAPRPNTPSLPGQAAPQATQALQNNPLRPGQAMGMPNFPQAPAPQAPAAPSAPPAYNPMGGNSNATMAQHYPNGTPPGPMSSGVQNQSSNTPYFTP